MTPHRVNPFIPEEAFLERRSTEYLELERRRQDSRFGWEKDREIDLVAWLSRIDRQRGQLADIVIAGGRWHGYDRKAAVKQLVQIAALARRAVAVISTEIYEAEGEHVDDGLMEMFRVENPTAMESPKAVDLDEVPF